MTISNNKYLNKWVDESVQFYQPDEVVWYDGSDQSHQEICNLLVDKEVFIKLNEELYPNSYWCRSDPNDVARVEDKTFICSEKSEDAGPTNNWEDPKTMEAKLASMMKGCMKGRTMYVVPYLMGPHGSKYSRVGIELTDSPYVVANMQIMALTGVSALEHLNDDDDYFVHGIHSKGQLDPENRYIAHFPESLKIISYNTNYGGNVLQGKKCFALRLASYMARKEEWLAEHMLILGITNPQGKKFYIAAAFPSACGKTNLAMLVPPKNYQEAGWKVETVGDDIAWINFGSDGKLHAINPEQGFFGVAPGTSEKNNPNALATVKKGNTIFTNTAYDPSSKTPWWDELSEVPGKLIDWQGDDWKKGADTKAAHPNSRFTTPAEQCPSLSPEWQNPEGVPISAIVFGGRRAKSAPLVYESYSWQHGVFIGAAVASETTAAAAGEVGMIRRDPMAMRPFIGYHVGDYLNHWLEMGKKENVQLPKIFHVNWFRTDENDQFLWPGFGDNMRVLEWITKRVEGQCDVQESPLGFVPNKVDINIDDSSVSDEALEKLFTINPKNWKDDIASQKEFFAKIGNKLPKEIMEEHEALCKRLNIST